MNSLIMNPGAVLSDPALLMRRSNHNSVNIIIIIMCRIAYIIVNVKRSTNIM